MFKNGRSNHIFQWCQCSTFHVEHSAAISSGPRHHEGGHLGIAVVQHLQQAFLIEGFELSSAGWVSWASRRNQNKPWLQ